VGVGRGAGVLSGDGSGVGGGLYLESINRSVSLESGHGLAEGVDLFVSQHIDVLAHSGRRRGGVARLGCTVKVKVKVKTTLFISKNNINE
jgi:hypothetical protein